MSSFREEHTFEERSAEAQRILEKYPDRIPVIVEKNEKHGFFTKSEKLPDLDKKKYLTPSDLTYSQFMSIIRKRMKLNPEQAIFMFVGNDQELPPNGVTMNELYSEFKNEDGFLYFSLSTLNSFGFSIYFF